MRDEYTLEGSAPNPYAEKLRKPVTLRLDVDTIAFFKAEAARTGIPYQNLINLYLGQCAQEGKHVVFA
ncbi:MAG: BrnA antitoxin family protein [Eggerthellaceae bacterium]|nr:BrnA antitoxin family protein [Eggerthellaceae bacterium]